MEEKKRNSTQMLVLTALFTALIAVGAFIRIPIPALPFTLQTLFTTMAALMLGPRYGTLSCVAYMVLGLVGLPIFTAGGGPQYVFQPSFGYIIGFAVAAWVSGMMVARAPKRSFAVYFAAALVNMVVVYIIGMAWVWVIMTFYQGNPIGLWTLFTVYCFQTLAGGLVKAFLAAQLALRVGAVQRLY